MWKCYSSSLWIIYARSVDYTFILDMSKILYNIYIWVVLVNSESVLVLAFVKYMLYSYCTQSCIFLYFWRKKPLFCDEKLFKIFLYFAFILSKHSTIDSRKTSMNQEWLVVESCLTPCWITFFKCSIDWCTMYALISMK